MSPSQQELLDLNLKLAVNIQPLMTWLGIDLSDYHVDQDIIVGPAPCHGGDNPKGWKFFFSSGLWCCWTRHCEENYGRNCLAFIRQVLDISFPEALQKAREFLNNNQVSDEELKKLKEERITQKRTNYWQRHKNASALDEKILDSLQPADNFAQERGLSPALFRRYKIGISNTELLNNRVVIPIRNFEQKLVGLSGRKLSSTSNEPKWFHWPKGTEEKQFEDKFHSGSHLFNIDIAWRWCVQNNQNTYILVEGPFDVIKIVEAGVFNVVCTFGCGISEGQIEVLKQLGASRLLVAYDGDEPGEIGAQKTARKLEKKLFHTGIIELRKAFPNWPEEYGSLDWANRHLSVKYIPQIIEELA